MKQLLSRLSITIILLFIMLVASAAPLSAAQFFHDEELTVAEETENLYATGNSVRIIAPVMKDAIAAGNTVIVQSEVERNIVAAGNRVTIKSPFVGASVRAVGAEIRLTGTINEDVILAGRTVVIENAEINGDLVVVASTFTLRDSKIDGKFMGMYEKITGGSLENQVAGPITAKQAPHNEKKGQGILKRVNLPWEISVIVTLIVVSMLLQYRNRLAIPSVRFNGVFVRDIFVGLCFLTVPFLLMLVSFFVFLFPLVVPLAIGVYLMIPLVLMVLPIYIANIVRNSFLIEGSIVWMIVASYLVLFLINLIPGLKVLNLVVFVLFTASIGFLIRVKMQAVSTYLAPRTTRTHKKPAHKN